MLSFIFYLLIFYFNFMWLVFFDFVTNLKKTNHIIKYFEIKN